MLNVTAVKVESIMKSCEQAVSRLCVFFQQQRIQRSNTAAHTRLIMKRIDDGESLLGALAEVSHK